MLFLDLLIMMKLGKILENKINSCVRNYGVGNFGLDQSFFKI